jgi:nitrile hydratase
MHFFYFKILFFTSAYSKVYCSSQPHSSQHHSHCFSLVGYPPDWYKSDAYRARAVRDPRGLLSEWGVKLPFSTQIHIVDSTADYRWMVLPMRPAGTEQFSEEQLFDLLTRDCLVGAGLPQADSSVSAQNT